MNQQNHGKCGVCGDNYADPVPRSHESGGAFASGIIVRRYAPGQVWRTHARVKTSLIILSYRRSKTMRVSIKLLRFLMSRLSSLRIIKGRLNSSFVLWRTHLRKSRKIALKSEINWDKFWNGKKSSGLIFFVFIYVVRGSRWSMPQVWLLKSTQ